MGIPSSKKYIRLFRPVTIRGERNCTTDKHSYVSDFLTRTLGLGKKHFDQNLDHGIAVKLLPLSSYTFSTMVLGTDGQLYFTGIQLCNQTERVDGFNRVSFLTHEEERITNFVSGYSFNIIVTGKFIRDSFCLVFTTVQSDMQSIYETTCTLWRSMGASLMS